MGNNLQMSQQSHQQQQQQSLQQQSASGVNAPPITMMNNAPLQSQAVNSLNANGAMSVKAEMSSGMTTTTSTTTPSSGGNMLEGI